MNIYFAPLEGITDSIFRRAHKACFSGVDKYFIPFVSPTQNLFFTTRDLRAISPKENEGLYAVPQIMAKNADLFLWCAQQLADMGYTEVNLNIGCPSSTVTAKGKGAGMLRTPDVLVRLLDEIYAHSPLPVSVKTRIGYASEEEWPHLLSILAGYPIHELILHPRTRTQFYTGTPHTDAYDLTFDRASCPIVCNGDLFTKEDCAAALNAYPDVSALMLGRGLIANPALARHAKGGEGLTHAALRRFHDLLLDDYLRLMDENYALNRMQAVMKHIVCCFEHAPRDAKSLRKSANIAAYRDRAHRLFEEHELRENPCFLSDPESIH